MPEGTRISVEHLFQNTPARLAFQRRPETETARIVDVVVSHALAHPECAFHLKTERRTLLNVPATDDMLDRLYDIMGAQATDLIGLKQPPDDEEAPGSERWEGWISTPDITRGKGRRHPHPHQRPSGCRRPIPAGHSSRVQDPPDARPRHPVAVLNLTCPPSEVDVNVHPTKREVRLRHSWRVLERLERAIAYSLEQTPTEPDATGGIPALQGLKQSTIRPRLVETHLFAKEHIEQVKDTLSSAAGLNEQRTVQPVQSLAPPAWAVAAGRQLNLVGDEALEESDNDKVRPISSSPLGQSTLPNMDELVISPALSSGERQLHRLSGSIQSQSPEHETPLEGVLNDLPEMEPLAQFADSYILVQAGDELLLVDQHALHERIRYERLRYSGQAWEPQKRLTPLPLELDARQSAVVDAQQKRLISLGFHVERINDGWCLTASPQLLDGESLRSFFLDVLQDVAEDGAPLETIEQRKDHIAFMNACRGAVKANQSLTLPEMRRLLDDMRRIPNPWACVHGRPTSLRIPVDSLDHHFGRHG